MASRHNKDINATTTRKRKRLCGICGQEGHDRRSCRSVLQQDRITDINLERRSTPPRDDEGTDLRVQPTRQPDLVVLPQLGRCLYCVLDLETTGFSRSRNHIIEVAAQILKHDGVMIENGSLSSWEGTHRTVYVDRFYTSLDLLRELRKMNLYVTGTIMKNRIPSEVTIGKTSRVFKDMNRGDFKRHRYSYMENGKQECIGLVCWRDRDIVYCVSNEANTVEVDTCIRRSKLGLQTIKRPTMIRDYNWYMGGVDLADMRRLHCNSTVMCQNRWWLKLFSYLLDVGTSNALVLYNLTKKENQQPTSIVDFKSELVMTLVGTRFESLPEVTVRHLPL